MAYNYDLTPEIEIKTDGHTGGFLVRIHHYDSNEDIYRTVRRHQIEDLIAQIVQVTEMYGDAPTWMPDNGVVRR